MMGAKVRITSNGFGPGTRVAAVYDNGYEFEIPGVTAARWHVAADGSATAELEVDGVEVDVIGFVETGRTTNDVDELRRVVDQLEAARDAVRDDLVAKGFAQPELVTDATTGRYLLLDALAALARARIALLRAAR